jgi:predicted thioredoxin/glutaredoxin
MNMNYSALTVIGRIRASDYRDFVRSFFTVSDDRARDYIKRVLVQEARLWAEEWGDLAGGRWDSRVGACELA